MASGPTTTRTNVNAAPLPGLTGGLQGLLSQFMQTGQPFQNQQPSALQQQSNAFTSNLFAKNPGQGVVDAAQPIFQRNLQQGADTLRQAGPRFASNTERLVGQQGTQAMQDFNLFTQNALQEGVGQQLQGQGLFNQQQGQFRGQNMDQQNMLFGLLSQLGAGPAVLQQNPGWFAQLTEGLGAVGSLVPGAGDLFNSFKKKKTTPGVTI